MADGGSGALSRADEMLIREVLHERWRLQREASALSDAKLAVKFDVPRHEIVRLRKGVAWSRSHMRINAWPREGTNRAKMLGVLREGPSTAAEIADTLRMDVHNVVAQLHDMEKRDLVKSRPFNVQNNPTHKTVKLYALVGRPA
jgi:hypothetical protein